MNSESNYNSIISKFEPIQLSDINQLKLLKRVDNKFVMPVEKLEELLNIVKKDYKILEINGYRDFAYHTTYFDTPKFDFYLNHQNQRLNRHKIRMRNYMVSNDTFLEVKRKTNKGKTIKTRKAIDKISDLNKEDYSYLKSIISLNGQKLAKSSENSFHRITLVSFKTNERITLDYNIKFWNNKNVKALPFISIVEVKRDKADGKSPVTQALKKLKVYSRGFSKYCMGLTYLYPDLKQNNFKPNKLYLKKIEYATTNN